jgi:hypothetical protein
MQVTSGKAGGFPEADVLLDVLDASTGIFPFQTGNGAADFRQPAALVVRGDAGHVRNQTTPSNNLSFYSNVNNWITPTSARLGADGLIRPLTGAADGIGAIMASWLNWVVGVDPSAQAPSPVGIVPYWQKLRWESVVRCKATAGRFFHGWFNGTTTDPFNTAGGGQLAITLMRNTASDSLGFIAIRNLGTGAGSETYIPITPIECVSRFLNIRWEVTLGPTFRVEVFVNDELVWGSDLAGLALDLSTATAVQLVMQAGMLSTAGQGFEGPYYSRGTITRVK